MSGKVRALAAVIVALGAAAPGQEVVAPATPAILADAGFRLLAAQPDGTRLAAEALASGGQDKPAIYDWLRAHAKAEKNLALECRLLAALARELRRPAEEIGRADDLVLQCDPGRPEGWINRAEQHAARADDKSAGWAVEAYDQGLRRVDFSSPAWKAALHLDEGGDWLQRATRAKQLAGYIRALADALRDTPQGMARLDAVALVVAVLRHDESRAKPETVGPVLAALEEAQPQLVLGDVTGFIEVLRGFETAGKPAIAKRIARLLIRVSVAKEIVGEEGETGVAFAERWSREHPAPVPPAETDSLSAAKHRLAQRAHEAASAQAAALRGSFRTLLNTWEDTMPRYQTGTTARLILATAMGGDEKDFATHCIDAARSQPWNENLISHALLAVALTEDVTEDHLSVASALSVQARGRLAQRLHAFAPDDHVPLFALAAWVEGGALATVQGAQGKVMERAVFESLLLSMDGLQRADAKEALARVLAAVRATPPRALDVEHWQRLSVLTLRAGDAEAARELARTWLAALDFGPVEKEHLLHIANAAVLGGVERGGNFAHAALEIWKRQYEPRGGPGWPEPGMISRVAQALIATDRVDDFRAFVTSLEPADKQSRTSLAGRMVAELAALRDLLDGKGSRIPAVDVWVRSADGAKGGAAVQWQFVLPELGASAERPVTITTGDRDSRNAFDKLSDARWWRAGTPLPALARLSARYDLALYVGESSRVMNPLTTIREAKASGEWMATDLPATGCVRASLREPLGNVAWSGQPQFYSTLPALFATGREPGALEGESAVRAPVVTEPRPASWTAQDEDRWGRLIAAPVALETGAEYLLTRWTEMNPAADDLAVRMILLDEKQRPLGPVPVVSTAPSDHAVVSPLHTPAAMARRALTQRFRPGDWEGDGDLVEPRSGDGRAGAEPPRFFAFVTREKRDAPPPLLQLRPFGRNIATGISDESFTPAMPPMPELNDEHLGDLGFYVHSWHITFASDRGIITGKGALAGFDVTRTPWRPLVRAESPLIEGNEWPMCFTQERALVVEPTWNNTRDLAVRFLPFDTRGANYAASERLKLPLPAYNSGEIAENLDGAVLMASSERGDKPEPVCAWMEPDGRCHVVPLPRPPIQRNPGLEVAWWGPGGTKFTLHEDGLLFHMEHLDGLRLLGVEPGSPDDMPEGCSPGKRHRKRTWTLDRPDVLTELDKKTGAPLRRFHLATPCEGRPMSFDRSGYVILFTTEHEIIRVNPPPRR